MENDETRRKIKILTSEYSGILPYHEVFYIQSIIYSASRAHESFSRYDRSIEGNINPSLTASSIQEALGHSASLSRFFWPSGLGKKSTKKLHLIRGKRLRLAFELRENSPLRNRNLRDALEHFDERLDQYLLSFPVGQFFPTPLIGDSKIADEPTSNIFKLVDPERNNFVLLDEKYQFSAIRNEVDKILEQAINLDNNGGRLPSK